MFNLVPLAFAAALVSLSSAALLRNKIDVDNSLQPNVVPAPKRLLRKYVHIHLPPPDSVRLLPGQRLELECQVYGSPSPAVSWLKDGQPLIDFEEDANEILATHPSSIAHLTSKLVISNPSNEEVYTCVATSGVKQQRASTTVYIVEGEEPDVILEKLLIVPKPVITSFYNEVFQSQGTNIVLPCRVAGKAQVFWQDNNDNIVMDSSRIRVLPSGDLFIMGLKWTDMGQFTCVAQNAYGKDTAETFLYPTKTR